MTLWITGHRFAEIGHDARVTVQPATFWDSGSADDYDLREWANGFASMPLGTVLSHRSAARLWGIWLPRLPTQLEVTTPASYRGSRFTTSIQRGTVIAHRRILSDSDVVERFGLPVTSLVRTWIDLAALIDVYDLVAAGDSALRAGCADGELLHAVASTKRQRGIAAARVAVGLLNSRSESRPESRIRAALVLAGLPEPRVNEPITDRHGGWLAKPDLHYREAKLAIEFNGADHADLRRMRKDATRTLSMQRDDWVVRTYVGEHAFGRLGDVVDDVRQILRKRAPHLLVQPALSRRVTGFQDQRRANRRL